MQYHIRLYGIQRYVRIYCIQVYLQVRNFFFPLISHWITIKALWNHYLSLSDWWWLEHDSYDFPYIYIYTYIYIYWESSSQLTLTPFSRGVEMAPPTRSEETWRPIFAGHRKTGALLGWVMFAMKTWLEAATKTWELYGNIWEIYGNIWESIGWSRGISWHLTMN